MSALDSLSRDSAEDLLLPRDTTRSVPLMLIRARVAVMSRFQPLLAQCGLSEQQWRVIRTLAEADNLDAHEVAERACVLGPSLSRIIKTLQARRLVLRRTDPEDRRRVMLSLTPAGVDLIAQLTHQGSASYADFVREFGADRIDKLLDMLNDLVELRQK